LGSIAVEFLADFNDVRLSSRLPRIFVEWKHPSGTVDGKSPASPRMYKTLQIMGYLPYQLVLAGFLNHQP